MKSFVVIPARGGSKGIPGKNSKLLVGKPLIQYAIDTALEIFDKEEIIVSTDDISIKQIVESGGIDVPFLRPAHLATDTAGTYEVLLHAVEYYERLHGPMDALVLLQPTSPFRTSKHVKEAMDIFKKSENIDMVVSVNRSKANPYYNLFEENKNGYLEASKKSEFIRRQDCPPVWEYNGAVYIIDVTALKKSPLNNFKNIKKYEMSFEDSLDLDTPIDWSLAELILQTKDNS